MSNINNDAVSLIKDVKPGSKNLHIVFIVLEIGKFVGKISPLTVQRARAASCFLSFFFLLRNVDFRCQ